MATQPDWRADPTMPTPRPPAQDPWSDYPHVPGMPVSAEPTLANTEVAAPPGRRPSPDEPWFGSAPVTRPDPPPTEELREPAAAPAVVRLKRNPYVRPDLPKPRQPRAWHVGRIWSWWGLFVAFCCWGVWAANNRGRESVWFLLGSPLVVFVVGVLLFVVTRFIGRLIIDSWRTQPRKSARLAHFITFLYFAAAGIGYLRMTTWVTDAHTFLQQFR